MANELCVDLFSQLYQALGIASGLGSTDSVSTLNPSSIGANTNPNVAEFDGLVSSSSPLQTFMMLVIAAILFGFLF